MADTRSKLIEGATRTIRSHGIAGVSARTVAAAAGVNQALVFYHFGNLDTCSPRPASRRPGGGSRRTGSSWPRSTRFGSCSTSAGACTRRSGRWATSPCWPSCSPARRRRPALAGPIRQALELWVAEIEAVLTRVMASTPLGDLADAPGLARAVSAAFIGLELFEGVDPDGAHAALNALDQLGLLVEVVEDLGPVARRALRAKLRSSGKR